MHRFFGLLILLSVTVSGCAGLRAPERQTFDLSVATALVSSDIRSSVHARYRISDVVAFGPYDTQRILVRRNGIELFYVPDGMLPDRLPELLTHRLAQGVNMRSGSVVIDPSYKGDRSAYQMEVFVTAFEVVVAQDQISFDIGLDVVVRTGAGGVVRRLSVAASAPVVAVRGVEVARAMNAAFAQVVQDLSDRL